MDKYRPKRPTTLALMPQRPQAGTQGEMENMQDGGPPGPEFDTYGG